MADFKFCDKCGIQIVAEEKFCSHCGSQNIAYDYKDEPLRIEHHKNVPWFKLSMRFIGIRKFSKMRIEHHKNVPWFKSKNIAIFAIIGIIAIIIITVVATQNAPLQNDGALAGILSEPIVSVLPTRDDGIETEWKMEAVEHDYNLFVLSEFRPEGFTEAVQVFFIETNSLWKTALLGLPFTSLIQWNAPRQSMQHWLPRLER